MAFTPESMQKAENLDRPHVIIDNADPLVFYIEWKYFEKTDGKIDPIIELFRSLRDRIRKENDVHIVATSSSWTDRKIAGGRIRRKYVLSYCPGERRQKDVDPRILASEFKTIQPRLLSNLQETLDTWLEADNGLALYLEEGNKESIHSFLVSVGLRQPEPKPKEKKTKTNAEKRAERRAYATKNKNA